MTENSALSNPGLRQRLLAIRDNKVFELFVISVIILSSVAIGVKTYALSPTAQRVLEVLDYGVTLFFLVEILIRLAAEPKLKDFFSKGWNVFDFTIVVISLIPLDDSEYALLARILRLFRVMRLISFIPELRLLVNALLKALPRMGYVGLLMFIIFYVYAVVGNILFEKINPVLWGDLGISLLTLFRVATFEDWTDVMYETMTVYPLSWIYYLTFIFFSAFVFLNMMIGVVVDVLDEEHKKILKEEEEDVTAHLEAQISELQSQLVSMQSDVKKGFEALQQTLKEK
jgi:voltage-gated sodium channel